MLNSGETNDDLFDADGNVIDNCTTGMVPTVTGFTLTADGDLSPINGSTRKLASKEATSGCAQVSFTPDGSTLVVTERLAQPDRLDQAMSDDEVVDDEGVIDTWVVGRNGRLQRPRVFDATGQGPFGFTFLKNGALLTTEQFDGPNGPGRGGAASYTTGPSGVITPSSFQSSMAAPTRAGSWQPTARPSVSRRASSVRVGSRATRSTVTASPP